MILERGKLVNLLVGIVVCALPLYLRVTTYDFNRTSKDNLAIILYGVLVSLMPDRKRVLPISLLLAFIYSIITAVLNQHQVSSINVIMQSFYMSFTLMFFVNYYEKHDGKFLAPLKWGCFMGCLIQSAIAILGYHGTNVYPPFIGLFTNINNVVTTGAGASNSVGSLGNNNLLASYLAITSMVFFEGKFKYFILVPMYALFCTHSFMGNLSFYSGAIYFLNYRYNLFNKAYLYLGAAAAMLTSFLTGAMGKDNGRFQGWHKNFDLVDMKHLLIGKGPGWFPDLRLAAGPETYLQQEHNGFLTAFNVGGIVLFLLLLPVLIKFLRVKDSGKTAVFASMMFVAFCNSFGHFSLHQSTVVILIIMASCICLGESNGINLDGGGKRTTN